MSEASGSKSASQLSTDLKGKRAFIAGVTDDNGYGWAIAKSLAAAGAEILVGTWVPGLNIFEMNLRQGKFDESGPLGSRDAKAIGFIDTTIDSSFANVLLQKELFADEVGNTAAFLASP